MADLAFKGKVTMQADRPQQDLPQKLALELRGRDADGGKLIVIFPDADEDVGNLLGMDLEVKVGES